MDDTNPTKRGLESEKAVEAQGEEECRKGATANAGLGGSLAPSPLDWSWVSASDYFMFLGAFGWGNGWGRGAGVVRMN